MNDGKHECSGNCAECKETIDCDDTDTDTDTEPEQVFGEFVAGYDKDGEPITIGYELPLPKGRADGKE